MKKVLIPILTVIIFIFAYEYISTRVYSPQGNKIVAVKIANQIFYAEVVSSDAKMQKGLGGRKNICQACGMLFKFPKAGKYAFWMRDMRFSLDILWLKDKKVVHIEKNVQPEFAGILNPGEDADMVLEIRAGVVDSLVLKIGDIIYY